MDHQTSASGDEGSRSGQGRAGDGGSRAPSVVARGSSPQDAPAPVGGTRPKTASSSSGPPKSKKTKQKLPEPTVVSNLCTINFICFYQAVSLVVLVACIHLVNKFCKPLCSIPSSENLCIACILVRCQVMC